MTVRRRRPALICHDVASAAGFNRRGLPRWQVRGLPACACSLLLLGCADGSGVELGDPRTLASSGASNPTIAASNDGSSYFVAWISDGERGGNVHLARISGSGEPEGSPVRVNDVEGDADPHEQAPAQVVVAPGGDVYVIWQRKAEAPWLDFGGADLRFARSSDGGRSFEPAITVNDNDRSSPARISFHGVTVGADGTVYISWIDARERDRAREEAYRANPESHADSESVHLHPASVDRPEPGTEIRIAASRDGGRSFSPSVIVDGDSCPCCRTAVVVGPDGTVYTAWRKIFAGGIRDIAVARSGDGGRTFSSARAVHPDQWEFSACPHAGPSLAVDGRGRLHAAWYNGAAGRQGLWYAVSDDGGDSFSAPIALLTDEWVPPSQARLAVDGDAVWVAWDDLRETTRRVHLARITDGRVAEVGPGLEGRSPALVVAGGRGSLAWHDGEAVRVATFHAPRARNGASEASGARETPLIASVGRPPPK
jgi:hypothetical protein